jgi:hypothetical protein
MILSPVSSSSTSSSKLNRNDLSPAIIFTPKRYHAMKQQLWLKAIKINETKVNSNNDSISTSSASKLFTPTKRQKIPLIEGIKLQKSSISTLKKFTIQNDSKDCELVVNKSLSKIELTSNVIDKIISLKEEEETVKTTTKNENTIATTVTTTTPRRRTLFDPRKYDIEEAFNNSNSNDNKSKLKEERQVPHDTLNGDYESHSLTSLRAAKDDIQSLILNYNFKMNPDSLQNYLVQKKD